MRRLRAVVALLAVLWPALALAQDGPIQPWPGVTVPIFGIASSVDGGGTFVLPLNGPQSCATPAYTFTGATTSGYGFASSTACIVIGGTGNFFVAANSVQQRNGATAQRFDISNTYTSAISNELFSVDWQTTANNLIAGTRTAATGTGRNAAFVAQGDSGTNNYTGIVVSPPQIGPPFIKIGQFNASFTAVNFAGAGSLTTLGFFTSTATSGSVNPVAILPTYNQASGNAANTDLLINRTQTLVGSGAQLLIDAQVSGVSKFSVDNTGALTTAAGINSGTFVYSAIGSAIGWGASRSLMTSPANGQQNFTNNAGSAGIGFDFATDGLLKIRNRAQNADGTLSAGVLQGAGTGTSVANVGANSCGTTTATIAGNQVSGVITVGATSGTQCRVTFSTAAPVARDCTVTDSTTTIATRATVVDTLNTDFFGAFVAGDKITYQCTVR